MKYIISQADLADLKAKAQSWLSANCRNPYYYKTKKRITAYLNLCTYFYMEETTLTKLIKKYFKNATKTFYRWSQKIMTAYYSDNLDLLLFKTWIGYNKLDHIYVDFQIKYNYEESRNIKMGRNSYTDEFKKQIVLLYQNRKTILEIFKEYGVSKSAVYQWIEKFNNSGSFKAKDNHTVEENELLALRKELIQLRMENDILKQAALIIGKK